MSRKLPQSGRLNARSVRCKPCNKAHSALQRMFAKDPKLGMELKENFKNNSTHRTIFMKNARGLMGDELHSLLRTQLTKKKKASNKINLKKCIMHALRDLPHMLNRSSFNQEKTAANVTRVCTLTHEENLGHVRLYIPPLQQWHPLFICCTHPCTPLRGLTRSALLYQEAAV